MLVKFPFKQHFQFKIATYLLLLFLVPFVSSSIVLIKTNPTKSEKLSIFIAGDCRDSSAAKTEFESIVDSYENKKIDFYYLNLKDSNFETVYLTKAISCDLVILPQSGILSSDENYYFPIEESNRWFNETNFVINQKHYGISVSREKSTFLSNFDFDSENLYAFISKKTVHSFDFNNASITDQVDIILEYLCL